MEEPLEEGAEEVNCSVSNRTIRRFASLSSSSTGSFDCCASSVQDVKKDDKNSSNGEVPNIKEKKKYADPNPLPEPLRSWRLELKRIWLEEKEDKFNKMNTFLENVVFPGVDNPFDAALSLTRRSNDFIIQKSNSMAGTVIRTFEKWLNKAQLEQIDHLVAKCLDDQIKLRSFKVGTEKHTVHLDVIVRVFRLKESPSLTDALLSLIRKILESGNIRDAIQTVALLGYHEHFTAMELVIPCILQDRTILAENYLNQKHHLQLQVVEYMDGLLIAQSEKDTLAFKEFWKERGVTDIKWQKFVGKTLQKFVARMIKMFSLSDSAAPNFQRLRTEGSIRHVVFKRFVERSLSEANFSDYVEDAVAAHPAMKIYLLEVLVFYKQLEEAAKWVVRLDLQKDNGLPLPLIRYMNEHPYKWSIAPSTSRKTMVADGTLVLPEQLERSLLVIDTKQKLDECINDVISDAESDEAVIGLDTEWRPLFICSTEQVALLQIATRNRAYLIDVMTLESILTDDQWKEFFQKLLCTEKALKLGFDFSGDLRILAATFPHCRHLFDQIQNVVCLVKLVRNLCSFDGDLAETLTASKTDTNISTVNCDSDHQKMANSEPLNEAVYSATDLSLDQSESSDSAILVGSQNLAPIHFKLADLCYHLLNQPLDKSEQFGNWARRPLRPEQIHYAAMDAYCQLLVYDALKQRALRCGLIWEDLLKESLIEPTGFGLNEKKKVKNRLPKKKMDDDQFCHLIHKLNAATMTEAGTSRSPTELKLAVDSMIRGLGKHLRRCGVDCIIADDGLNSREKLIQLAKAEARIIISIGKAHMALSQRIPTSLVCIPRNIELNSFAQLEFVLKHFRVCVTDNDIFSRCMLCNSGSFVLAPCPVLQEIYNAMIVPKDLFNPRPFDRSVAFISLSQIDPDEYDGYGVQVRRSMNGQLIAECYGGSINIETGHILSSPEEANICNNNNKNKNKNKNNKNNNNPSADNEQIVRKVKIESVFASSLSASNRVFLICIQCGKVYWYGKHLTNFKVKYGDSIVAKQAQLLANNDDP